MKYCQICNAQVGDNDRFCYNCGSSLVPQAVYCRHCGEECSSELAACPKCGQLLREEVMMDLEPERIPTDTPDMIVVELDLDEDIVKEEDIREKEEEKEKAQEQPEEKTTPIVPPIPKTPPVIPSQPEVSLPPIPPVVPTEAKASVPPVPPIPPVVPTEAKASVPPVPPTQPVEPSEFGAYATVQEPAMQRPVKKHTTAKVFRMILLIFSMLWLAFLVYNVVAYYEYDYWSYSSEPMYEGSPKYTYEYCEDPLGLYLGSGMRVSDGWYVPSYYYSAREEYRTQVMVWIVIAAIFFVGNLIPTLIINAKLRRARKREMYYDSQLE